MSIVMPESRVVVPLPSIRRTRTDQIAEVVSEALEGYRKVLDAKPGLRSVTIDVKLRDDGRGVRACIISLQEEIRIVVRGG